jgi:hypothetical protein
MKSAWMTTCAALAVGLWVGVGCGSSTEGPPGQNPNGQQGPSGLCSATQKCPAGQWCFNGLCAPGCNSNQDCAADQYCDTKDAQPYFCKNKTVSSCPSTPCQSNQECRNGLCTAASSEPSSGCTPSPSFNDSCDKYSVCVDEDEEGPRAAGCLSFPPCPENGVCPVGIGGAVCNEKYIPNKGRFCMPGACSNATHCPADWKCVRQTTNQILGFCSAGGPYALCFLPTDCLSGICNIPAPGFPGMCQ